MKMKFPQNVTVHIDSTGCHHQCPADGVVEVSDPNLEKEFLHAGFTPVEESPVVEEPAVVEEKAKAGDSEENTAEGAAESGSGDQQ